MKRRVLLMSSSALVVALAAGGCGGDGSAAAPSTESSGPPASQTADPTATPAEVERADGLALLVKPKNDGMPSVKVFDWETGEAVQYLPFELTKGGFQVSVSKDLRYAVRRGGYGEIELYKSDPVRGYVLDSTVKEEADSFGTGKVTFGDDPRFNPKDGRAWMTADPAKGDPYFVSVDPEQPKQKPRRERARRAGLAANSPWGFDRDGLLWESGRTEPSGTITVGGKNGYELEYTTNEAGGIASAGLTFTADPTYGPAAYTMIDKLAPNVLLLGYGNGMAGNEVGELLQVTVDLKKRTASYRTVVPTSADPVQLMALYPDRRSVLIVTAKAWYKLPLGGTSDQAQKLPEAPTQSLGKLTQIP